MSAEHLADVRYFSPSSDLHFKPPQERVRMALLTSIRDLVMEGVGSTPGSKVQEMDMYVKGTLERGIDELRGGYLSRYVELVAIITDDLEKDLAKTEYPLTPTKGRPWIHPLSLRIDGHTQARDLYFHIPSRHRLLKLSDKERRAEEKQRFEEKIYSVMRMTDAQILVSDHFIGKIEYLIRQDVHGLFGKVLNTHPGITDARHPFKARGLTPYQDAIDRARGYRIVPGTSTQELIAQTHDKAGSSFHVISPEIDAGQVLCDTEITPVFPDDKWPELAARNYRYSKPVAFRHGLMHYSSHIFPDLKTLQEQLTEVRRQEPLSA